MTDIKSKKIFVKRNFFKNVLVVCITFSVTFYILYNISSIIFNILFGTWEYPVIMHITFLNKCPACFGISICPELYSNKVTLEHSGNKWPRIFNKKNIYHGYGLKNRRIILKNLAHQSEFDAFDSQLCEAWNLDPNCKPKCLLNLNVSVIEEKIINLVKYNLSWPEIEPRNGLVMCPYASSLYEFLPLNKVKSDKAALINIWTSLKINPEPLLLQNLPQASGWPVPAFAGVCGRLEVVAYDGEPLSSLMHIEWHRKLKFAKQILDAAMDFTFKHERFRFYFMDWSLDNIVANENDVISFVDLEDVIVLDKFTSPTKELPNWYERYYRESGPGFTFSIENICKHHLSDHNIWAACYLLIGDESPYLYPLPNLVKESRPYFETLLQTCLTHGNRFNVAPKLQHVINEMLTDEKIMGYGAT